VEEAHRWCTRRCESILALVSGNDEERPVRGAEARKDRASQRPPGEESGEDGEAELRRARDAAEGEEALDAERIEPKKPRRSQSDEDERRPAYREDGDDGEDDDDDARRRQAIDGRPADEDEALGPALDAEDDAILLRLHQRLRGALHGKGKAPVLYDHVFVDEVQDCGAIDLAVLVDCTAVVGGERSMTLAGDVAQRLTLDTGLGEFAPALEKLGLPHVEVEPLTIGYRSTRQVLELAREVLGPLAPAVPPIATRDGAPIEHHVFGDAGAAAASLAAALRDVSAREPMASVALVSRHPWQADVYFDVLSRAEIPNLRRVRDQDFPFRAGIDVTDVKQVKGLEWDYVILLDVNASVYGQDDESRHLLHIAITRAAHQLWLVATGEPSALVSGWDG
jgi:DNA helicase-2/ATP-dependent DNA helicase PcrA